MGVPAQYEVREATSIAKLIANDIVGSNGDAILAVNLNNVLTDLQTVISGPSSVTVEHVTLSSAEGLAVYKKSISFLLSFVFHQAFPTCSLSLRNALGSAYYFEVEGPITLNQATITLLSDKLKAAIAANYTVSKLMLSYNEAVAHFQATNRKATAALLKSRTDPTIEVYGIVHPSVTAYYEIARTPIVPHTALLSKFELVAFKGGPGDETGLLLRYPSLTGDLSPFKDEPILTKSYADRRNLLKTISLSTLAEVNDLIVKGQTKQLIQLSETVLDKQYFDIAQQIYSRRDKIKLILIAGPSSSGKTTFAHRLNVTLQSFGLRPVTISVDDYYNPPEKIPLTPEGNRDYERVEALNIEQLNENLLGLFAGETVEIPSYDFHTQRPKAHGHPLKLPEGGIIIMEGIHCLSPVLTNRVPRENKFLIAITPLTSVSIDSATQTGNVATRILRRMVRDYLTRGHSAMKTLQMWPGVRFGEHAYIFPNQNLADAVFNSGCPYEINVLRTYAEPLLKSIPVDSKEYNQARTVHKWLQDFVPMPSNRIPPQSLILEFIGGSWYYS
mmetsp:Transcript_5540/g.9091  ORF Transcript_5540/g.9091 Transcript_5540/m.9091 type:complete len:558 (-) Transcript_5540:418-2091(-)